MHEFKPKKSKFGFRFNFYTHNILQISHEIVRVFGYPPRDQEAWWMEVDTNMNNQEIRLYIDSEDVYHQGLMEMDNVNIAIKV